jgi:hypothetical protein
MNKILIVLLAVLSLSACKQTPTEPEEDPVVKWIMPAQGSQYRMGIVTTDSGAFVNTDTEEDIFYVLDANVPWAGRDSTFRYGWGKTMATYHVTFEPNGDTGYEIGTSTPDIYPTGAKGRTTYPTETDTYSGLQKVTTRYRENVGREKITLAGVTYNSIKVVEQKSEVTVAEGTTTIVSKTTTNQTWWFVTELGIAGKVVKTVLNENGPTKSTYFRSQTLTQIVR